jgi:hypothetical protein
MPKIADEIHKNNLLLFIITIYRKYLINFINN